LGIVLGHLFWPQKRPLSTKELVANAKSRLSDEELRELAEAREYALVRVHK
jgi:hypothetical protein